MARTTLFSIDRELANELELLRFGPPTAYVYNPLVYAGDPHQKYLDRYGKGTGRVLLLGMNPGPFGMVQTGVPFGDVKMVRDFLRIEGPVERPDREHPRRRVLGFACPRSEVSGTRLWGWARDRYRSPEAFFQRFFVANYCPLAFLESSGSNRTPDKLGSGEREPLLVACDRALRSMVELLKPSLVVGVGVFAEKSARRALSGSGVRTGSILHPSPANPKANSGWAELVEPELRALGVAL